MCPACGRRSIEMNLAKGIKYMPSEQELKDKPHFSDMLIKHEVLICPCGKQHTWYTLERITITSGWADEFPAKEAI
jgi:hypothetical protein